jgi:hypothetical protein
MRLNRARVRIGMKRPEERKARDRLIVAKSRDSLNVGDHPGSYRVGKN